jgi:hypothetical protein
MITKRKSSLTALKGFVIVEKCKEHREEEKNDRDSDNQAINGPTSNTIRSLRAV